MNAPNHNLHAKLAEWQEQTTFRAFLLGVGKPDADDVCLALDVLKDHAERIAESMPEHAWTMWEDAIAQIGLAMSAVDKAIVESGADPVSDAEDFRKIDNRARMENIA